MMTIERHRLSNCMWAGGRWLDKQNERILFQEEINGQLRFYYYIDYLSLKEILLKHLDMGQAFKRIVLEHVDTDQLILIPHVGPGYTEREFCEKHWEYLKEKGYDAILWPYMQAPYPRLVEYDTDQELTRLGCDFWNEFHILCETDDELDDLYEKDTTFRQIVNEWADQQGIQIVGEDDW